MASDEFELSPASSDGWAAGNPSENAPSSVLNVCCVMARVVVISGRELLAWSSESPLVTDEAYPEEWCGLERVYFRFDSPSLVIYSAMAEVEVLDVGVSSVGWRVAS